MAEELKLDQLDPVQLLEAATKLQEEVVRLRSVVARRRLPDTRQAITHKFDIANHEGYITVGLYEDGTPGEVFITMAKEGSTIGGLLDAFGAAISIGLQYGVPLERLVRKFAHERFEPSGFTKNPDIPIAKSIADYVFRWMACNFIPGYREANSPAPVQEELKVSDEKPKPAPSPVDVVRHALTDCPDCDQCGQPTVRNGACYKCLNCGNSMGCS